MTELRVQTGVELPAERARKNYPYAEMSVGDSFFVPNANLQVVCNANNRAGKRLNAVFIARKRTEGGTVGVRVWRKA